MNETAAAVPEPAADSAPATAAPSLGDLPQVTPGRENPASTAPAPAGTPPGQVDAKGVAFDPIRHTGRKNGDGSWSKKPGNAQRKANGQSFFVPPAKRAPFEGAAKMAADRAAGAAPPAGEDIVHDGVPLPPGEPIPGEGMLDESAYEHTAKAAADGIFGVAQMFAGKEWEPSESELRSWRDALRRLWHHYQLPRLGPLLELVMVAGASVGKRADQPKTKGALAAIKEAFIDSWRWMLGMKRPKKEPAAPTPTAQPPSPAAAIAAPAPAAPRASADWD